MSQDRLELTLSMLCRRCGRKLLLMSEKLEAQMNGGLCQDCVGVGGSELKVIDEVPQRRSAPPKSNHIISSASIDTQPEFLKPKNHANQGPVLNDKVPLESAER
jgi:hypothetical protein